MLEEVEPVDARASLHIKRSAGKVVEEIELHIDPFLNEEQLASLVEEAAARSGLQIRLKTTLRTYPGSQHWHLTMPGERGTLEITCWLTGKRVWFAVHANRRDEWIKEVLPGMKAWLEGQVH